MSLAVITRAYDNTRSGRQYAGNSCSRPRRFGSAASNACSRSHCPGMRAVAKRSR